MFVARKQKSFLSKLHSVLSRARISPFTPSKPRNTALVDEMAPNESHTTNRKRKTSLSREGAPANNPKMPNSRQVNSEPCRATYPKGQEVEENGFILQAFYGPEMSNARALAYKNGELPRPIEVLNSTISATQSDREKIKVKDSVVHWFKCDLRTRDNRSLFLASEKAKEKNVPLITMYIVSPQDFEAHLTSPARVDFIVRTLEVLKEDLAKLNIPLHVETVEKRRKLPERILELLEQWGANHLFANMEFEVDELRRDESLIRACLENDIAMNVQQDTCVVSPGELTSGSGTQYSVYTPWFRAWLIHIHQNPLLLDLCDQPHENPEDVRGKFGKLFESIIPHTPDNKKLNAEEKEKFRSMWPPGEHEAHNRLRKFADERIREYQAHRNFPAEHATSSLSVHLASGTLSARTAVRTARDHNHTKRLDNGNEGIQAWISEIAWRDFYRHILAHWPYIWHVLLLFLRTCV
jgi:deoxyribodipyrimidine photo-lyase